jgi:hypothetical protein
MPIPKQGQDSKDGVDINAVGKYDGVDIFDVDLEDFEDKPWRKPGADITDYFNFGFNEATWKAYCTKQKALRDEFQAQNYDYDYYARMDNRSVKRPRDDDAVQLSGRSRYDPTSRDNSLERGRFRDYSPDKRGYSSRDRSPEQRGYSSRDHSMERRGYRDIPDTRGYRSPDPRGYSDRGRDYDDRFAFLN